MIKQTMVFIAVVIALLFIAPNPITAQMEKQGKPMTKDMALVSGMRYLWEDHVVLTRNVIFCLVDSLPGSAQATKRLLQNQDDIGNAFRPYYGDEFANRLTKLLHAHIDLAADVIKAAKVDNTLALFDANKKWYANADDISACLAGVNPAWTLGDLKLMMYYHLKLTTDETEFRIKKDYDGDVKAFDKIHYEIIKMADWFSEGIIKQYPAKFRSKTGK